MAKRHSLLFFLVILSVLLMIPFAACAQSEDLEADETETEEVDEDLLPDEETLLSWPFTGNIDEITDDFPSSLDPDGILTNEDENGAVTFVSGNPLGTSAGDDSEAYNFAVEYMDNSDFDLQPLRSDSFKDVRVYTFQQMYNDTLLSGSYLKIVTNQDGDVLGIVSSLVNDPDEAGWDYSGERQPADWEDRFAYYQTETYEKTVTSYADKEVDISVPLLFDPETGEHYLGDKDRLIFCVDIAEIDELDDRQDATPISMERNLYSDGELLTYYLFIQVYDYYAEKGWWGPDGDRNPCMLQFDTSGEYRNNASYASFQDGFHIFNFSVDDGAGQSLQVIAHEFNHGVSSTNHIGFYRNETGALDEALSDLIGNAVEADLLNLSPSENPWLNGFRRAHKYEHALYIWDEFYTPPSDYPDTGNDYGDVHHNANVISVLAWRMYEAGMTPRDVFDFWFIFDLTLTPKTDFAEAAAKAPWVAEIAGLQEYAPIIRQAVEDLKLTDKSLPQELPEHQGLVVFENPLESGNVSALFFDPWSRERFTTWPVAGTNTIAAVFSDQAYYMLSVMDNEGDEVAFWNGIENRWDMVDSEKLSELYDTYESDYCIKVRGGEIVEPGE